jgi:DNA-binding LytR/AlgR family response regulator
MLSPHRFIRVHRSYLVTRDKVESYDTRQIKIEGHTIPIGRIYKTQVEEGLS